MVQTSKISYKIKTSKGSKRKYPNVIWFPRSKTDPREIRQVLRLALETQKENPDGFFNDTLLGVKMAKIGSISVVGLDGQKYIDSYKDKSTGDVSFVTNARMLMRLFRFLGLVTRIAKGKYQLTDLGKLYAKFSGDFPSDADGVSEEKVLLNSLANFAFYCVADDSRYRDPKFRIRPFLWLLHTLEIEPQCIYQLIVTAFASRGEGTTEDKRIKTILGNLRSGNTTLKDEWHTVGLNANDYSCVHNFYDSVKILVYLGMSLGLIKKTTNAEYGKKIAGKARHLKQANIFYTLTEKGIKYLEANLSSRLLYYDEIHNALGDDLALPASFLLATLNFRLGKLFVTRIKKIYFSEISDLDDLIIKIEDKLSILIDAEDGYLSLKKPITFSFFQHIPPEIMDIEFMKMGYHKFMDEFNIGKIVEKSEDVNVLTTELRDLAPYLQMDEHKRYIIPARPTRDLEVALRYPGMDEVFGGTDRFSGRVSPTNSIYLVDGKLFVDQKTDALDLLVLLRLKDSSLTKFIEDNIGSLLNFFVVKSDIWEKDQYYTWIRNAFRHLGMEALYSGSGGMLSRADVSILNPFIGGVEAKSPRENRGTLSTKAIRQAVDAKIQVADKTNDDKKLSRIAIAIGRRISDNAIREEKKWANEGQPVLLLNDVILQYIILKSSSITYSTQSLVDFFTKNHGVVTPAMIRVLFEHNTSDPKILNQIDHELGLLNIRYHLEEVEREEP